MGFTIPGFPSLFLFASGLTVDGAGNIRVADSGNGLVRKIAPAGTVTSHGRSAQFFPNGIAADVAGNLYVVDGEDIGRVFKGVPESTFSLIASPQSQTIARGSTAVLTVAASGADLTYQNDNWGGDPQLVNVSRSTGAFALTNAGSKDAVLLATLAPGDYTLQVRSRISGASSGALILAEIFEVP